MHRLSFYKFQTGLVFKRVEVVYICICIVSSSFKFVTIFLGVFGFPRVRDAEVLYAPERLKFQYLVSEQDQKRCVITLCFRPRPRRTPLLTRKFDPP